MKQIKTFFRNTTTGNNTYSTPFLLWKTDLPDMVELANKSKGGNKAQWQVSGRFLRNE